MTNPDPMIIIDTDGDPLDPADRYDGDYLFECDTAEGTHTVHVCLGTGWDVPDIDDAAILAQDVAEAKHGVGGSSSALYEGLYRGSW